MIKKHILFFFLFIYKIGWAQQLYTNLNTTYENWVKESLYTENSHINSAIKPYLYSKIDYNRLRKNYENEMQFKSYSNWLLRKVKHESFIIIDTGDIKITIDPYVNLQLGKNRLDSISTTYTNNTRGYVLKGNIGTKLSFMSSFYENQVFLPSYQNQYVNQYLVVPGQGRTKPFKVTGYDFAMASGYVSYSPFKTLNLQFGHDKNFIGDGYRSLLLSDNSFNYPFLKINAFLLHDKIHYSTLYASLQNLERIPFSTTPETTFKRKAAAFHILGITPVDWLQVTFFEATLWQRWDSTGSVPFDYNFINPVLGVNSLIYGLRSSTNSLLGATISFRPLKSMRIYFQLVADDLKNKKSGYQIGMSTCDIFKLKGVSTILEYNNVNPYTYSHPNILQNYSHYNQALAHPLGAGFEEFIVGINYRFRDFYLSTRIISATTSNDSISARSGTNIFMQDTKNYAVSSKNQATVLNYDFSLSYLMNRKSNMNIVFGYQQRTKSTDASGNINFVYVGLRTTLNNYYFDF